jgi:DNA invertase Pin-like site-specific DNA recombinase
MTSVALYCRISQDQNGRREGVDAQERWGREYAARTWPGLPVVVFCDNNLSAFNGAHRPGYEALRSAIADGQVAQLWAVEQSRLERREAEWFRLAAELLAAGITELHTNRDGIIRVGEDVAGIKAVLAAGEVRRMRQRINDRLAENAAKGEPAGALPFGYVRATTAEGANTYAVVPQQAKVIRWAADKVLAGWALTSIARALRERKVKGAKGGTILATTVRGMLTNPTIAGKRVHQGRVVGDGNWPPILDPDTWERVRTELGRPRRVQRADGSQQQVTEANLKSYAGRRYVLTGGLAVCGVCGAPLKGTVRRMRNGERRPSLVCHVTSNPPGRSCVAVGMKQTERVVLDALFEQLDRPQFLAALAADDHDEKRRELVAELHKVEAKRNWHAEQWAADQLTEGEWTTARQKLADRGRRLRTELAALPAPLVVADIATARLAWPRMTLDEQREFVRLFIAKVTVGPAKPGANRFDPERIRIEWARR